MATQHPHGSYLRYQQGCTAGTGGKACRDCKSDWARYQRERNARKRVGKSTNSRKTVGRAGVIKLAPAVGAVAPEPTPKPSPASPGPVETAVRVECDAMPIAKERPATVQQALAMARILDDIDQQGMWNQASRQLHTLLESLRVNTKRKSKGRLAAIQAITTNRDQRA